MKAKKTESRRKKDFKLLKILLTSMALLAVLAGIYLVIMLIQKKLAPPVEAVPLVENTLLTEEPTEFNFISSDALTKLVRFPDNQWYIYIPEANYEQSTYFLRSNYEGIIDVFLYRGPGEISEVSAEIGKYMYVEESILLDECSGYYGVAPLSYYSYGYIEENTMKYASFGYQITDERNFENLYFFVVAEADYAQAAFNLLTDMANTLAYFDPEAAQEREDAEMAEEDTVSENETTENDLPEEDERANDVVNSQYIGEIDLDQLFMIQENPYLVIRYTNGTAEVFGATLTSSSGNITIECNYIMVEEESGLEGKIYFDLSSVEPSGLWNLELHSYEDVGVIHYGVTTQMQYEYVLEHGEEMPVSTMIHDDEDETMDAELEGEDSDEETDGSESVDE